jgi:hypothetical protein
MNHEATETTNEDSSDLEQDFPKHRMRGPSTRSLKTLNMGPVNKEPANIKPEKEVARGMQQGK